MKKKFNIIGMTCSSCSSYIEKVINQLDGVKKAEVNLLSNNMFVSYDEKKINEQQIVEAVVKAGYKANVEGLVEVNNELKEMKQRIIISIFFMILLMYISMGHMISLPLPNFIHGKENAVGFVFLQFLLLLPIIFVNHSYFTKGFKAIINEKPNMDSLIALGSSAAILYGIFAIFRIGYGLAYQDFDLIDEYRMNVYFESAGMILTLITLGKYLETISKNKTSEAITKLMNLAPKKALILKDYDEIEVNVEEIKEDDIVIIKPGYSIPVDGIIIEGNSSIEESFITGESLPVEKTVGDHVIAGTINKTGFFHFKALKVGDNTTLAGIIKLVEEAGNSKAPISKLADKISGIFVPIVIIIACLSTTIWLLMGQDFEFAFTIGISVLVISCPCALGLATPVAIMVGTGIGAHHGILIKSAESLETLHKINTIVFDKTGTITEGKPEVIDIVIQNKCSEKQLLEIAFSLETLSEHPLAEAIIKKSIEKEVEKKEVKEFLAVSGLGLKGKINNKMYYVGNLKFMNQNKIELGKVSKLVENYASEGKTVLYFADDKKLIGLITVKDKIKKSSKKAIEELRKMGIDVVMLTGDHHSVATSIKKELEIDTVISEVLPQEKEQEIIALQKQGQIVAMCGDGINDSIALVRSNVGIAIGSGTDIAIESADIILMKDDLMDVVTSIRLSKMVIQTIKMNLFWAFFYNVTLIPLSAGLFYGIMGLKLNPMLAALAMSLSSVTVVINALRINKFKKEI